MSNISQIYSHFSNLYRLNGVKEHKALFILGPMGVGKSTFIGNLLSTKSFYQTYIKVDTDEIMIHLPSYNAQNVCSCYPEARVIAKQLTNFLMENGINFIAEGTCVKWKELLDYMIHLNENRYHVEVKFLMSSDIETVLRQASYRSRNISNEIVRQIYFDSLDGCRQLIEENKKLNIFSLMQTEES